MEMDETPEQAAIRELKEETGVEVKNINQFRTYGAIDRDPRHRTISTVFYAVIDKEINIFTKAGDDASEAKWFNINKLPDLAFDHGLIISELLDNIL